MVETSDGVLLRAKSPFPRTTIDQVAGCLNYKGKAKTLADMQLAIKRGVEERFS